MICYLIYSFFSIYSRFNLSTCHTYDLSCNFSVQFIIFHQKDFLSCIITCSDIFQVISCILTRLSGDYFLQCCGKSWAEQRFWNEFIYSCCFGFFFDFCIIIGRQNNDRNIRSYLLAYLPCCFNSIHSRHLPVNNIYKIIIAILMTFHCTLYCLFSWQYPLSVDSNLIKNSHCSFTAYLIIIHNQHGQVDQFINSLWLFIPQTKENSNGKSASLSQLAFYLNVSIHHIDDISCDCHSQTGSLDFADAFIIFTSKRVKHNLLKFLAHSHTVVLNHKLIASYIQGSGRLFRNRKQYLAAIWGIFDGITHNISKYLLYS